MAKQQIIDPVISNLLDQYTEQREALKIMIEDVEKLKARIDTLFPEKLDQRLKYVFEEKLKSTTAFFNVVLDIRKELIKTLRDEIEVRRKITTEDDSDVESLLDVRKLAKKIESFNKKTNSLSVVVDSKETKKAK